MKRKGNVFISGRLAGILEEVDDQKTKFTYEKEWLDTKDAVPVSLTMPLRSEPFVSEGLHPFFENLLPEGWLLEISSKRLKISKDDAFGLLIATGGNCIGAVEIKPDNDLSAN